jgi:hypothetical protein
MTKTEATAYLRTILKPGDNVYCILQHVSQSGMSRSITLAVVVEGGIRTINYHAAIVMDRKIDQKNGGIKIGGCGMDMGFALVYDLGRTLFPGGFGVQGTTSNGKSYRPATKRAAALAVKRGVKFYGRNVDSSGWDNDGGYALESRWL